MDAAMNLVEILRSNQQDDMSHIQVPESALGGFSTKFPLLADYIRGQYSRITHLELNASGQLSIQGEEKETLLALKEIDYQM